jgi:surface antigen
VSDEPTSDPMDALFASREVTPFDQPVASATPAQNFSSRRELREATGTGTGKRPRAQKPVRPSQEAAREARASRAQRSSRAERQVKRDLAVRPAEVKKSTGPVASAPRPAKKKHPLLGLLVVLAVPAFIVSASLPAFAFASPDAAQNAAMLKSATSSNSGLGVQVVPLNAAAKVIQVQRDKIGATSTAELAAQRITAAAFATVAPRAAGDDYPWPTAGNTLSPLNYYYRQCVDFVAWRLNRDAGVTSAPWKYVWSNLTPNGGSASEWKSAWEHHGWKTSSQPVIGAVAWFQGNHVAYVKSISGSNVTIEEYNGMASLAYAIRTIPSNTVARFLYPPPR